MAAARNIYLASVRSDTYLTFISYGCWNWLLYEVYFVYHIYALNQAL